MPPSPKEALDAWMRAVNGGDLEGVLGMYDESAVLIPTFSNRMHNTPGKIRDYFERLGSRKELSVALHEKTLDVQVLREDLFALSGIYNWRFEVDGEMLNFEARFSFVLDLAKPRPVLQHHSSQIPRTL